MRVCVIVGVACLCFSGCTSLRLERSTANQARTLTQLQYQQVMNNLAMYFVDPWAVPSQVGLRDGSTQVADAGAAGFLGQTDLAHKFASSPTINGSRSVVEQWGMLPVTDENNLRLLRMAYRRAAFGVDETLATDADFRNQLAHELKGQIAVTEDLRRSTDAYYQIKASRGLSEYYARLAASPEANRPATSEAMLTLQAVSEGVPATPAADYGTFDAQVASANDACIDCELTDKPVEVVIRDGKPNQGYPVEVIAGKRVIWLNECEGPVVVTGDAGVVPFTSLTLPPGSRSTPVAFPTPSLTQRDNRGRPRFPDGYPYRVGRQTFLLKVNEPSACGPDEDPPRRWVVDLSPGADPLPGPVSRLTLSATGSGESLLIVKTGDFVVWHNRDSERLVVEGMHWATLTGSV